LSKTFDNTIHVLGASVDKHKNVSVAHSAEAVLAADGKIIPSGELDVSVNYMGTPIFQTQWDLCTKAKCPIHPGDVKIHYTQNLPPVAPPVCISCLVGRGGTL
jgi:hypothetical protein